MMLHDPIRFEFCVSPNVKWISLGCWNNNVFGLFSVSTGALIWSTNLNTFTFGTMRKTLTVSYLRVSSNDDSVLGSVNQGMEFVASSMKLIIGACNAMFAFALPCLIDDYKLEFQSASLNLAQDVRDLYTLLHNEHQNMLPKHIMKQALTLHHGIKSRDRNEVLDVASSRIGTRYVLLIRKYRLLFVVLGGFKKLFASSFKEYIEMLWYRDALTRGVIELTVDMPTLKESTFSSSQQFAWIFVYPNKEKHKKSIVVFCSQDGLLGVFIDVDDAQNQDQVRFEDQKCFALKHNSNDKDRVFCLLANGVVVIDLNKREVAARIPYKAHLEQWLVPYITIRYYS